MDTYDIPDAETDLSRLVEKAAKGEPFLIAKAGKPMVKVVPPPLPHPSGRAIASSPGSRRCWPR